MTISLAWVVRQGHRGESEDGARGDAVGAESAEAWQGNEVRGLVLSRASELRRKLA